MTNQQHPDRFDWATELLDAQGHVTLSEQEAHEIGARLRSMGAENETLQAGYAAARLEIESLQARIKTMAEEHADELMVAHLDGRAQAAQPARAQQPGDERAAFEQWSKVTNQGYDLARNVSGKLQTFESTETEHAWRGFFHGLRASHGQAPAQVAPAASTTQQASQQEAQYDHGPQAETVAEAARDVGKWLNERPNRPLDLRHVAMLAHHATAPQQEAQGPVAWYVTGCGRLLDEDEAKAEARHIGGTARAIPLYTAPQADSVLEDAAQVEIDLFNDLNRIYGNTLTAYAREMCRLGYRKTNAASKQGANHD